MVTLPVGGTKLDVKLCVTRHDLESMRRSRKFVLGEISFNVATAEDIVLYKLQYWRGQDQVDVRNIKAAFRGLDLRYIKSRLGVVEEDSGEPVRERWSQVLEETKR